MTLNSAATILLLLLVLLILSAVGRSLLRSLSRVHLHRSILVHASAERAWRRLCDLPLLVSRHGRAPGGVSLDDWSLREGDGETPGSVWRGRGGTGGRAVWVELQITRREPASEICFRLIRDSLKTHRALRLHRASLTLREISPGTTKVTWQLQARLHGPRLLLVRLLAPSTLRARLVDVGLRSVKGAIESLEEESRADLAEGMSLPLRVDKARPQDAAPPASARPSPAAPRRPPSPPEATT
jgi:hypothetical protein